MDKPSYVSKHVDKVKETLVKPLCQDRRVPPRITLPFKELGDDIQISPFPKAERFGLAQAAGWNRYADFGDSTKQ